MRNRAARARAARAGASRDHAVVHRVAALLLEYPTPELVEMLPRLREAVGSLPPTLGAPLAGLVDHLASEPLTALQARYVETFDLRRRCSLYLSYYAYGDTRKRGLALVTFKQAYRAVGFELTEDELPDHLGVVLEFAATGGTPAQEAGIRLLLEHRAGLELLRLALLDTGSPYAAAVVAVCATLPPLEGDEHVAVARLAAEGPPGEEVGLEPFAPPSYLPATGARR
ncbi:nitrate reductase molybdenum cofactor assembly chaperone [Cellulomonas fimi]|uniref:Nitrate reductase molybdenum cofactor assembly chaperone n=1 Tax=Cellulomonas fimi TaxID=1708 RepID=A0A7Y0QJA8_CELFI|nr:nitrate reductase molybdenum cofactor assembly chaperone [Cellulomonas fimi]NMR21167.1 nitrate reductase molybdenum cofactor assembly chaperone [Cellulomonas fimi]